MKRFISFGSIEHFRTVIKNVQWMSQYKGKDENDNVIMDRTAKSPKITAVASEKIHGTNASVCYSNPDGFWVQSRKNIITPEKDNAACAFQVMQNEDEWMRIINDLSLEHDIDLDKNIISVYFEWCGGNIQKKACVTGLDKMAIIFRHFKVSPLEPQVAEDGQETAATWHETCEVACGARDLDWVECKDKNIFNVMNFPTVELEIDFDASGPAQNKMIELTEAVEKDSGVGLALYQNKFGGSFEIKEGKFSKEFPPDLKEKLKGLNDGVYTLSF